MPLHQRSPHFEVLEFVSGNSLSKLELLHGTLFCQLAKPKWNQALWCLPLNLKKILQFQQFTHLHLITFAKLQTIPVGTADSNKLNHATTMKWRMESHLRNGNTLRTRSCLCRHKSSSSWLSRLPQYQRSDHDSSLQRYVFELVVSSCIVAGQRNWEK